MTDPRLPHALALSQGVGLQTVDLAVLPITGKADSSGTIIMAADPVPSPYLWRVERLVVTPTLAGPNTVQCGVYGGSPGAGTVRDWVDLLPGSIGVAEYPQPLTVDSNTSLMVQITGAKPGDSATAVVQYAVVQRTTGGG